MALKLLSGSSAVVEKRSGELLWSGVELLSRCTGLIQHLHICHRFDTIHINPSEKRVGP